MPDHPRFPDDPRRSLKVLFTTSTSAEGTIGSTENLHTLFKEQNPLDVERLANPTYSILKDGIKKHRPDILHFVGHGEPGSLQMRREPERMVADEAAYDVQKSERRNPAPVEQVEFVEVSKTRELFGPKPPRLVFLQTCFSGAVDREALYSTAVEIVKGGVPAVIAMQYDIGAEEADVFATAFYRSLIEGDTIGQAVWAGRKQLASGESRAWDHRDFGTPVIYVNQDFEVVEAPKRDLREDGKKPRPKSLSCTRCKQMAIHDNCPRCRLPLYCPCPGPHSPDCTCKELLELPDGGYCAACKHEFDVPPYDPGAGLPAKPGPRPMAPTGTLRSEQDGFELARLPHSGQAS